MEHVSNAIACLQTGNTAGAYDCIKRAMARNANDPLAHVALGTTLFLGGRTEDAGAEFRIANDLDPSCGEAMYGRALVELRNKQFPPALTLLCQAQAASPKLQMQSAIQYVKLMAQSKANAGGFANDDAGTALDAYTATQSSDFARAQGLWQQIQQGALRAGCAERVGFSMTFLDRAPLAATGSPLSGSYKSSASASRGIPVVSGQVTLKADLTRAKDVKIVAFFVDSVFVGMTNQPPFQYPWDTARVANGTHTVRITGTDSLDSVVSEKSTQVVVKNPGAASRPDRVTGDDAAKAWADLWDLMMLKPSAAAINANLGLCALRNKDDKKAVEALERAVAANPDYPGAADALQKLYRRKAPVNPLTAVKAKSKLIAITFDDGPKTDSVKLLDALKQKGVPATFFLVGKQVEAFPDIVRRMCDDGHEIQNHTYSHRALDFLSVREIKQELFGCAAVVRAVTGRTVTMMRPPGARRDKRLYDVNSKFGITTVLWTTNCSNTDGTSKDKVYRYVMGSAKPGAIILMHNLDKVTLSALPSIVDALRAKGYTFVTLSEMVRQGASSQ